MNNDLPNPPPGGDIASDARFDATLRARHRDALAQLSPRAQAQLQQRLRTALARPGARAWHPGWGMAAACSLVLVVAFGLHRRAANDAPVSPAVAVAGSDSGELVATLDEAPDLYLWLASDDANDILSE